MQLYEKHRPRLLNDVVGQSATVESIRLMLSRGLSSKAFYFIGESGTGKDTLANALCNELAIDDLSITRVAGADCTAEFVRGLQDDFSNSSLFSTGDGWKACLVSEAHGMSPRAVQLWLPFLEALPATRLVLFTSNAGLAAYGEFSGALFSRCAVYSLDLDIEAAAVHVARIATAENLNGQPIEAYRALLKRCGNNIRQALQCVEQGEMLRASQIPVIAPKVVQAQTLRKPDSSSDELAAELAYGSRLFKGSKKWVKHQERLSLLQA